MAARRSTAAKARRVAVVEPHVLQRNRTVELLHRDAGLDVVFAGESVLTLMAWMRGRERSGWPHLLVTELLGPGLGARDRAAVCALREAGVRVLLMSSLHPRGATQRILDEGVDGVVSKVDEEAELVRAVGRVLAGEPAITERALAALRMAPTAPRLSEQETKVLEFYAVGQPIDDIAAQIGVRPDTARKYLSRVKEKYVAIGRPAKTRLDLARRAHEDGLVE